jgi:hypothetical protein
MCSLIFYTKCNFRRRTLAVLTSSKYSTHEGKKHYWEQVIRRTSLSTCHMSTATHAIKLQFTLFVILNGLEFPSPYEHLMHILKYIILHILHNFSASYRGPKRELERYYEIYCVLLHKCTTGTTVKVITNYSIRTFLNAVRITIHSIFRYASVH